MKFTPLFAFLFCKIILKELAENTKKKPALAQLDAGLILVFQT